MPSKDSPLPASLLRFSAAASRSVAACPAWRCEFKLLCHDRELDLNVRCILLRLDDTTDASAIARHLWRLRKEVHLVVSGALVPQGSDD